MQQEHFDVLIVGAGLSGIGAGYHFRPSARARATSFSRAATASAAPGICFAIPASAPTATCSRSAIPSSRGPIRRRSPTAPQILNYVRETAAENGIEKHIRFRHRVKRAAWSTQEARWTVEVERIAGEGATELVRFTCNFLFMCAGYYKYEAGYTPEFKGAEDFAGRIVHPQKWTEDIDYSGKRVVVIGSGATAVTLVPELAKKAAQVTMLQRSPTYVVSRPAQDPVANKLRRNLPTRLAYHVIRWRNVLWGMFFFQLSRRRPAKVKNLILKGVQMALGPDYDVATHFTPRYNPWDQRLCLVPDGDLFKAIREKRAAVVTNEIDTFTQRWHPPEGRQRACGRHHRHGDRPGAPGRRRARGQRRWPRRRFRQHADLQGHDVCRRAEHGVGLRLHQRVLDAEMRSHLRICLPAHQLHGPAQFPPMHAAQ